MLAGTLEPQRGRLKISAPIVSDHLLLPVLPDFAQAYPEIELDLDFNDRVVDLIDEGVEIAIRSGNLLDSRLMARALRPFQMLLCASPAYLEHRGVPQQPHDLPKHLAVRFRMPNSGKLQVWPLKLKPDQLEPIIDTAMTCNNMEALKGAVIAGLGIGCMPNFLVRDALFAGRLQTVLQDHARGLASSTSSGPRTGIYRQRFAPASISRASACSRGSATFQKQAPDD
ncbi:LysR substrate-binding domain-containing protein [Fulvimarina manganoxydans]|uniref:LysR substrate-binding domain-containing protein n=1 Tax=Fulvimarina manganoxydans TaxID=937218 RepID=UPI003B5A14F3